MQNLHSDTYHQLITRRFEGSPATTREAGIDRDFYMDLMAVFHHPEDFQAKDFIDYPIDMVLDYLVQTHKLYLGKNLLEIDQAIEGLSRNKQDFEVLKNTLSIYFEDFKRHLTAHINEEENLVFPYIRALNRADKGQAFDYDVNDKIKLMDYLMNHSDNLESDLHRLVNRLKEMSKEFQDSFAFNMLVTRLSVFELDLRIHGRMEDEVLMPLALGLEKEILGSENA
jgi:regulator of cell morphogenesis and NO signaling